MAVVARAGTPCQRRVEDAQSSRPLLLRAPPDRRRAVNKAHQGDTRMEPKLTKNIGMLLLGIWLIFQGLIPLLNLSFSGIGTLMAILALAAGGFILIGR
jgi:hypothetical protein